MTLLSPTNKSLALKVLFTRASAHVKMTDAHAGKLDPFEVRQPVYVTKFNGSMYPHP
jgi:hypothetical protein